MGLYPDKRRQRRQTPLCALCGQQITKGEAYWFCGGAGVCAVCLPDLIRRGPAPCRKISGREDGQ